METTLGAFRELLNAERMMAIAVPLLRAAAILVAGVIAAVGIDRGVRLLRVRIVGVMQRHTAGTPAIELEKRAATIGGIIRRTMKLVVWAVAAMMALKELAFDITPILAGAGLLSLAVGFGAQNLVRDVIAGLFMLIENQISVNDVAIINGTGGLVQEINLRTTVLRGLDGTVHVFPNGAIASLSNMTREFSYYVFDVGVAYKEDTDRVVAVLRDVAEELRRTDEYGPMILEPLDVLGVDQFADSAVVIKVRIKTMPMRQWQVGREMNRRIKKRFDAEKIEIPFPHRSLYVGEASAPFRLQIDASTREELKTLVREVLTEGSRRA